MSTVNDGTEPSMYGLPDMSLRDYFAGQVMTGLVFCLDTSERGVVGMANISYEIADAMLVVRAKPREVK